MGLRDRLKATIKSLLGDPHASDPRPATARPAPARAPEAPVTPKAAPVTPKAAPVTPKAAPVEPAKVEPAKVEAAEPAEPKAKATKAKGKAKAEKAPVESAAVDTAAASAAVEWTDMGPSSAVVEGKAASWGYRDTVVAAFRRQGQLHVVDNACRHEDGPVGEGAINGCLVQCPYHDWEYDFTTGECTSNPGNRLTTYKVEERDGRIRIGGVLRQGTDERGGEHNDGLKVITR